MSLLSISLQLPPAFRLADILAFHGRDPQALAERVTADSLQKGLIWDGQSAALQLQFEREQVTAVLAIDGPSTVSPAQLLGLVRHLLGLTQAVEAFEQIYAQHAQLGPLLAAQPGLRVPQAATPFEALTWAITGQQISVTAATSMRRKLIKVAGRCHSGGLACYPDAAGLASLSAADLRAAGFSQSKAQTLLAVSAQVLSGELPLESWLAASAAGQLPVADIRQRLLALRGIGPWTVNYALLRGFAWLDGSLHGDVAVRRSLQKLLDRPEKISESAAQGW